MGKTNDKARELRGRIKALEGMPIDEGSAAMLNGADWVLETLLGDELFDEDYGTFEDQLERLEGLKARVQEVNGL